MNGLKDFSKIVNNYKALIVLIIAGKVLISIAFPQVSDEVMNYIIPSL